jgi:general nucleoside transport system permease protein
MGVRLRVSSGQLKPGNGGGWSRPQPAPEGLVQNSKNEMNKSEHLAFNDFDACRSSRLLALRWDVSWIGGVVGHGAIPVIAAIATALLYSFFLLALGKSPVTFFSLLWHGGFGSAFSWQNTLERASPLILSALAVALPARLGLIVIPEGALVIGGLAAGASALPLIGKVSPNLILWTMGVAGTLTGAVWITLAGWLRVVRGVNETISSLLLTYIAIAIMNFLVEGVLRDPASVTKPSTRPIGADAMIGFIPGTEIHWGIIFGLALCLLAHFSIFHTTAGFAARIVGGNIRAARTQGLPVVQLVVRFTFVSGAIAGLAGFFEVASIHGQANGSLATGFGFTGVLIAFLARQNPLVIPPVSIVLGGILAAGGLIQRRMGLPDASVQLLLGLFFLLLLASETMNGRLCLLASRMGKSLVRR